MAYDVKWKDDFTEQLFEAILALEDKEECYRFFEDIATIGEIKTLAQRLEVARMLRAGQTYDKITNGRSFYDQRVKKYLHYTCYKTI